MIVYGKTDQETWELTSKSLGIPLAEARQLLAIARGEVSGRFVVFERKARVAGGSPGARSRKLGAKIKAERRRADEQASREASNQARKPERV